MKIENKKTQKTIAFIIRSLSGGGAERVILTLAQKFAQNKYAVTLIIFENDIAYSVPKDIQLLLLKNLSNNRLLRDIKWIFQIRDHIKRNKVSTVISFLPKPNIYTILSSLFTGTRVIVSERNDPEQNASMIIDKLRKIAYKKADYIVFQTHEARDHFSKIEESRCLYIPNPLTRNLPEPYCGEKSKVFVNFCRLNKQKNLFLLLDAFYDVHQRHEDYSLIIYGEGEVEIELKKYIQDRNMSRYCALEGFRNDVHQCIRNAFCFVSSSNYEGISNSMLEAMALGIPVICTDCPCGGARMFIRSYENGILTPVGDKEELVKKMNWVIENPDFANEMGRTASTIRNVLDEDVIFKMWKKVII